MVKTDACCTLRAYPTHARLQVSSLIDVVHVQVTPQTLFRGAYSGCDVGPHVSQFLLNDFNFGNQTISQVRTTLFSLLNFCGGARSLLGWGASHV